MSDLMAFLKARLDEDEILAKGAARFGTTGIAGRAHWINRFGMVVDAEDENWAVTDLGAYGADDEVHAHIARHDPARVLREVEAKRAILKWHPSERMRHIDASRCPQCELTWPCPSVRYLAAVYSDHPDYNPKWVTS